MYMFLEPATHGVHGNSTSEPHWATVCECVSDLSVVPLEVEVHALPEALGAQQCVVQPDDLRTLQAAGVQPHHNTPQHDLGKLSGALRRQLASINHTLDILFAGAYHAVFLLTLPAGERILTFS